MIDPGSCAARKGSVSSISAIGDPASDLSAMAQSSRANGDGAGAPRAGFGANAFVVRCFVLLSQQWWVESDLSGQSACNFRDCVFTLTTVVRSAAEIVSRESLQIFTFFFAEKRTRQISARVFCSVSHGPQYHSDRPFAPEVSRCTSSVASRQYPPLTAKRKRVHGRPQWCACHITGVDRPSTPTLLVQLHGHPTYAQ